MSFVANEGNQISLDDSFGALTEREQKFLSKSWAKGFAENLFPYIDEKPFAVLYAGKASRPNTPINVIIGALTLKELMSLSDEELMNSLLFDVRFQYALHTTSMKEQPLSDRTLSRFRERVLNYETETGIDLIHECMSSLSTRIAKLMGLTQSMKRMDSMMIASNIKKLSRLELLYTCVSNMIKLLDTNKAPIADTLKHYLKSNDANKIIYHNPEDKSMDTRIKDVLGDARILIKDCETDYEKSSEYLLLLRVINEQTIIDDDGMLRLRSKDDPEMNSSILQNPSDPEATFRSKGGKEYRGYSANVIETADESGSVITDYSYNQNTHSDTEYLRETPEKLGKQDETLTLVADGAYGGVEDQKHAADKNIDLVTTNFTAAKPEDVFADFEFSEDGKSVIKCAYGQTPKSNSYYGKNEQCRITLDKDICNSCPFKDQCKPKFHKSKTSLLVSWKKGARAKQLRYMKTEEFVEHTKYRNGVESIPSLLRRKYHVDQMPVRGKQRTKFFFAFKIAAINVKKLLDFMGQQDNCAQISVLS